MMLQSEATVLKNEAYQLQRPEGDTPYWGEASNPIIQEESEEPGNSTLGLEGKEQTTQ